MTPEAALEQWRSRYPGREYSIERDGDRFVVTLFRPAARRLVIRRNADPMRAAFDAIRQAIRSGL